MAGGGASAGPELTGPGLTGPGLTGPEVGGAEVAGRGFDGAEVDGREFGGAEVDGPELDDAELDDAEFDGVEIDGSNSFAAVPDAFQRLWTPHRMAYIQNGTQPGEDQCPFCTAPSMDDERALIVARGEHAYVLLNLFPYNSGHLLVCPYRHISTYDRATDEETAEIASLTQTAMRVLTEVSRCEGFNIGMNQGRIAGAGIADHLHQHVVPRWATDSNFFPIIAKTKALPQLLGDVRTAVAGAWPTID